MEFNPDISIGRDLDKVFTNLPRSLQRKAYRQALRAGASVVRDAAEANLKSITTEGYATGYAAKQLRVYNLRKVNGNFRVAVQVRRGAVNVKKLVNGEPVRVGLYVSVLEYGKENQPPRSWIRKAIREEKAQAIDALTRSMSEGMLEAIEDAKK